MKKKVKFQERFEKVDALINELEISPGFDNVMGLTYLTGIVDVITPTPELREHLHKIIEDLIFEIMNFEFEEDDSNDEFMKDFV